ncbi:hypothetical protein NDU88_006549 [Pleurodeles waltl]|uniref:Uncharacterized protein n=1 Tax=Pleurodeles waltl TaxID=8319 RepID=A0AAV7ULX6_PLEWA|nr:hypothetical protein NDU88_006549 [Pleurodeles waltl]
MVVPRRWCRQVYRKKGTKVLIVLEDGIVGKVHGAMVKERKVKGKKKKVATEGKKDENTDEAVLKEYPSREVQRGAYRNVPWT